MIFSTLSELESLTPIQAENRLFLTLDIDWAPDFVLELVLDILEERNIPVTWFVTHNTDILERIRTNKKMEIGIHPNFNPLLAGDTKSSPGSYIDIIDKILDIVPEAKCTRSHSLVQAPCIFQYCFEKGIKIDSSLFVPAFNNDFPLYQFEDYSGIKRAPYFWGDYASLSSPKKFAASAYIKRKGLKIFNFHPIHLYLNSENLRRYEQSKTVKKTQSSYNDLINNSYGVMDQFLSLIETERSGQ